MSLKPDFRVSVAPMMDWTDRYCRYFHRKLSKRVWLYTEMVVADAVIHGDRDYLLGFDKSEHPVALQIGGSDPAKLAEASKIGADFGYDEINFNIGCPSDRVQSGRFGACLMAEPDLVAECYDAMQAAVDIPVTVKCRLGIDDQAIEETLPQFITAIRDAGCRHVIIHARKAWLQGLSPKENRTVPPLDYAMVRQMKSAFPDMSIELNGGLTNLAQAMNEAANLDGIMFGRAAYQDPWMLSQIDHRVYGEAEIAFSREAIIQDMIAYAQDWEARNAPAKAIIRHIMGLYAGEPGARLWRRTLSEGLGKKLQPSEIIEQGLATRRLAQDAA